MSKKRRRSRTEIEGELHWARPCSRPKFIPVPKRLRGARAAGKAYERKFAKRLVDAEYEPWFEFEDDRGVGWCAPDFLITVDNTLVVVECKLTVTDKAVEKFEGLYKPVLQQALGFENVVLVQVFKHFTKGFKKPLLKGVEDLYNGHLSAVNWLNWR